ncbi:MAG: DUF3054 family protein [Anaerolineales bacterium]|nr:DUF3054 family protein [Anaerolineales bacterium]
MRVPPVRIPLGLLLGDIAVVVGFVLVGMNTHSTLEAPTGLARFAVLAGPLLLTWLVTATALGAWAGGPGGPWRLALGRPLAAWLIAAPLALLARAWLLHSAVLVVAFTQVTLGLGGGLLLLWRLIYRLAAQRLAAARRA